MMSNHDKKKRNLKKKALALVSMILVAAILFAASPSIVGSENEKPTSLAVNSQLPKGKQTTLGLYVTAAQAYEKWKSAPDEVKIIDVRTPEEFAFVGHPEMAWNIPLAFVTYHGMDGKIEYGSKMNPDFVAGVKKIAGPTDTLLLMCRSGGRSAMAVNQLAAAGYNNAYNITDGMEGDKVEDPESVFYGKRMKNGWKNSGLPWVYSIDPEKIILSQGASKETQ
jgi:rhodanese-related sulfurtransferase